MNNEKSQVCSCNQTKFLGYTILRDGKLIIADKSLERMKDKIRKITKRNRGRSFAQIISELNPVMRGWLQYFQYAKCHKLLLNGTVGHWPYLAKDFGGNQIAHSLIRLWAIDG